MCFKDFERIRNIGEIVILRLLRKREVIFEEVGTIGKNDFSLKLNHCYE